MATYTPAQLQGAIVGAITSWEKANNTSIEDAWGLNRRDIARTLYQIAQAESGGTNAVGDTYIKNDDLNASYSPWQINKQHTNQVKTGKQYDHTKLTNNPQYAALAAIEIANDATSSTGDEFARYYPWTKHRMTNPDDKGPFLFQRGSDAPNDGERATAIEAFESGGSTWDSLDFSSSTYSGYNPVAVSGAGDVTSTLSGVKGGVKTGIKAGIKSGEAPPITNPTESNSSVDAQFLASMWENPETNEFLRQAILQNPDIDDAIKESVKGGPSSVKGGPSSVSDAIWSNPEANTSLIAGMMSNPDTKEIVKAQMYAFGSRPANAKSPTALPNSPTALAKSPTALPQNPNLLGTDDDEGLGPIGDTGSVPSWKAPPKANSLQVGNFKEKLRQALDARAQEEFKSGQVLDPATGLVRDYGDVKGSVTMSDVDALLRGTGDGALNDAQINSLLKASLGGTDEQSSAAADYLIGDLVRRVTGFDQVGKSFQPISDTNSMAAGVLNRAALNHNTDPDDRSRDVQNLLGVGETTSDTPERGTATQAAGFNAQANIGGPQSTFQTPAQQAEAAALAQIGIDAGLQQDQQGDQQGGQQGGGFSSGPPKALTDEANARAALFGTKAVLLGTDPWTYGVPDGEGGQAVFRMDDSGQYVLDVTALWTREQSDLDNGKGGGQYGSGQASNTSSGYSVRTDPATGNPQHWDSTTNAWKDGPPPNHSTFVNMSGETIMVDETGQRVGTIGIGFDEFANVRDFGENARQFNVAEGGRNSRYYAGLGEDARQFNTSFGEDVRQFDTSFGEDQRQFNTTEMRMEKTLAANNYFQGLEELGRNYRTLVQTSPEMANAATNQGKLITDILRGGGDVLARTYFTRGGMSPLPEITQADLINNLTDEMAKVQQFEVDATNAENQRRATADTQRAEEEYGLFRSKRESDARSAYQQFVSNMQPTQQPYSFQSVDTAGQNLANAKQAEAAKILSTFTGIQNVQGLDNFDEGTGTFVDPEIQKYYQSAQDKFDESVGAANASNFTTTETGWNTVQPTAPAFQDWRGTSRFAGQPTFADWQTDVGQSFTNTPMLNVPNSPIPQAITQEQLIAQSRAVSPPAVQSVLRGEMPRPLQFGGLPLPTFQQLQALTPSEQEMLNSRLLTEFNVPLSDVAFQTQRQFSAPSMDRNRDLAKFRGYSV